MELNKGSIGTGIEDAATENGTVFKSTDWKMVGSDLKEFAEDVRLLVGPLKTMADIFGSDFFQRPDKLVVSRRRPPRAIDRLEHPLLQPTGNATIDAARRKLSDYDTAHPSGRGHSVLNDRSSSA